ncbi:hypothetical protein [Comamonas sp. JC664]|uniref:hypothetical protein n=1 Tax=Comamonas sp. JC664 TaxID=2801917 RepID=UPI00174EAD7E|nr:hypothetical protein [Comamonas sp. JC664]MBL0693351.1 hypothetical protein [Comamonas sp. JC664]GHG72013.1 hypothetical protein GCM10012319_17640 [Comamonas sp. KCTC 72670]
MTAGFTFIANVLAWGFLGLGLLCDASTVFLFWRTRHQPRMASGVPVVALIGYLLFCAIRTALSLDRFLPLLAGLVIVHGVVQWSLPALLRRREPRQGHDG